MRNPVRRSFADFPLFHELFDDCNPNSQPRADGPIETLLALSLARTEGLRPGEKCRLAAEIGTVEGFASLEKGEAQAILHREIRTVDWNPRKAVEKAKRDWEYCQGRSVSFISLDHPSYPPQLRETYRPPFGLYVRGRLSNPCHPSAALVGTRVASGKGLSAAYGLAQELVQNGIWVVSGLAVGIDAAAHRGAVSGGGKTLAILPGGIESIYPPSNRGLASSILEHGGGLATEYPPFTPIMRYRFPERNRIIAGLSRSCVIVEAPEKSGALITAEYALAEGRDVFVHRACLGGSRNSGADLLAQQGAVAVGSAADIFAEWAALPAPTR
jgi:DNA processing protein